MALNKHLCRISDFWSRCDGHGVNCNLFLRAMPKLLWFEDQDKTPVVDATFLADPLKRV